ncbi:MAG: Ppx/GppA phosphatase family protein [bacterium]|nr:Ppx/GppA phosphatase family protein [bacterium]
MLVASIDIGTNTVRCLIGTCEEGILEPIIIRREIVRLGSGLRSTGKVKPPVLARLEDVLESFGGSVRESGCRNVLAVGTSALRDMAMDGDEPVEKLARRLGFPIRLISGEEEAALTSAGVRAGIGDLDEGLVVDIGGGSTELVCLSGGSISWWQSLPEGVVHLTEQFLLSDPPTGEQALAVRGRLRSLLDDLPEGGGEVVAGTAGTPTTLAALDLGIDDYDPTLVNGHVLSRETVEMLAGKLLAMSARQRLELAGMEKGREDLIAAGVIMVEEVMDRWGFHEMIVSDWGLLEGVALKAAESCLEGGRRKEE